MKEDDIIVLVGAILCLLGLVAFNIIAYHFVGWWGVLVVTSVIGFVLGVELIDLI